MYLFNAIYIYLNNQYEQKTDVTRCKDNTYSFIQKRGDAAMESVLPSGEDTGHYHSYSPPPPPIVYKDAVLFCQ